MWERLTAAWRWLVAQFAPAATASLPPALAAFLAGQSVRQATYLNQGIDPALMGAADWPAAIRITERQIRGYIAELETIIADRDAEIVELEQTIAELETEIEAAAQRASAQGATV
jgi:hypothetical protein